MNGQCQAETATGAPCKRRVGTENGTERLCGLHNLMRLRTEAGHPGFSKWRGEWVRL